jgi:hypothetical protein
MYMKKLTKIILMLSMALGILLTPENTKEHSDVVAYDPGGGGIGRVELLASDPGGGGIGKVEMSSVSDPGGGGIG